ncbi:uncharacterized protein METZ01_LOCUS8369 [marine metagenome]|uniref:Uncharacterized protein n=1 Tax=marine metagenome TaxID=408172 RepID=A0A381NLQ7_9ZZZZ
MELIQKSRLAAKRIAYRLRENQIIGLPNILIIEISAMQSLGS